MPLFKKNSHLDSREPKLIPVPVNDSSDNQSGNGFELDQDFQEGLSLFMENEGYETAQEALDAVAAELDKIIKPKILPKVSQTEPSEEKSTQD